MTAKKRRKNTEELDHSEKNALHLYMQDINRIPMLTKEEEEKTARLAAKGNSLARERLVNSNLRFVISIAKKYQNKGLLLEDLISEGNMGLLSAVSHFDVEKGYRFITYAVWWIRQAIIKAINEKGRMIRLPGNKTNELMQIDKTRQVIYNESSSSQDAEIKKIAKFLEMPLKKAEDLLSISQEVLSLDDPAMKHENSMSFKDMIEDECYTTPVENAVNSVLRDDLEDIISGLEDRAAEVIRSRYGLGNSSPLTLKEIGARYNLSRERVRQIEKRALVQLQKSSERRKLENYIA